MFKEIRSHFKAVAKRLLHLLVVNVRRKPLLAPYVFKKPSELRVRGYKSKRRLLHGTRAKLLFPIGSWSRLGE